MPRRSGRDVYNHAHNSGNILRNYWYNIGGCVNRVGCGFVIYTFLEGSVKSSKNE